MTQVDSNRHDVCYLDKDEDQCHFCDAEGLVLVIELMEDNGGVYTIHACGSCIEHALDKNKPS